MADEDFANDICSLEDDQGKAKEQLDRVPNWALKTGSLIKVNRKCSEHKRQQELDVQCGKIWESAKILLLRKHRDYRQRHHTRSPQWNLKNHRKLEYFRKDLDQLENSTLHRKTTWRAYEATCFIDGNPEVWKYPTSRSFRASRNEPVDWFLNEKNCPTSDQSEQPLKHNALTGSDMSPECPPTSYQKPAWNL